MALFIKLGLGVALLTFLVARSDRDAVSQVLGQLNGWVFLSLPIFYVHSAIRAWRWNLFLGAQDIHVPFLQANRIYLSGSFLGLLSPGRIGELYRVWILYRERTVSPGIGIASVIVDRLVDVVTLLSIGFLGFLYLAQQGLGSTAPALAWPAVFLRGRSLVSRFLRRQFQRLLARMPEKVAQEVPQEYRYFLQSLGRLNGRLLLQLVALTVVCIVIYCGHLYFVARVLGLPLSFWEVTGVLCAPLRESHSYLPERHRPPRCLSCRHAPDSWCCPGRGPRLFPLFSDTLRGKHTHGLPLLALRAVKKSGYLTR